MRLRFFGRLRDAAGSGERQVALPPEILTSEALRAWLGEAMPALLDAKVQIAVGDELATGDRSLADVDEVSFLPPVSGG